MEAITWRMTEKELLYLAALMNYQELYFVDWDVPEDIAQCKIELAQCKRAFNERAWIEEDPSGQLWVLPELNAAVHMCSKPESVWMHESVDEDGFAFTGWYYQCEGALLRRDMQTGVHSLWLGTDMLPDDAQQVYPEFLPRQEARVYSA